MKDKKIKKGLKRAKKYIREAFDNGESISFDQDISEAIYVADLEESIDAALTKIKNYDCLKKEYKQLKNHCDQLETQLEFLRNNDEIEIDECER